MIVCFIGIDGSGKTTCAKALQEELTRLSYDCEYVHYPYPLFGIFKRAFHGSPVAPTHSHSTYSDTGLSLRDFPPIILSFLEGLTFRLTNRITDSRFIIMDRYSYDLIVNYMMKIPRWPVKIYLKMVERPTVTILLDIDSQTAHNRKPEADTHYYEAERSKYKEACQLIGNRVIMIDGCLRKEVIVRTVLQCLRLHNGGRQC
jgi:thymidylate kinase